MSQLLPLKTNEGIARGHFDQMERTGVMVQAKMIEELIKERENIAKSAVQHPQN